MVAGTDAPLWGMEIDPDESTKRFRASSAADQGQVSQQITPLSLLLPACLPVACSMAQLSMHTHSARLMGYCPEAAQHSCACTRRVSDCSLHTLCHHSALSRCAAADACALSRE